MIRWLGRSVASAAPAVPLAGCDGWQSVLDTHGASAIELKQLIILIVAVCSLVWTLVMVALISALWRNRPPPRSPGQPRTERQMTVATTAAVVATAIIISGFTIMSFFATRALGVAGNDDLTIRVRGLQWWWSVEYLGPGDERFATANEIHIPMGRNVRLKLEGVDVIHSFWVPSLAGKQDLVPGRNNELTIRAERVGVYRGQCAEYCGMQHAHMALLVIADTQDDFDRWAAAQRQAAIPPAEEELASGQQTFLAKPCAACHTIRGTDASGKTGPDLTHVGSRRYIAAGLFEMTRGSLAAWIADPQTIKTGNNMPAVPLTPDELRSVSAYMASLK